MSSLAMNLLTQTSFVDSLIDLGETTLAHVKDAAEFFSGFDFPVPLLGLGAFSVFDPPLTIDSWHKVSPFATTQLIVGKTMFQVVESETLSESLDPQKHPVETRRQILDHAWRNPMKISIKGMLIGYPRETEAHKRALEMLQKLKEDATPITLVTDFPPGQVKDMLLINFKVTRKLPWGNGYEVTAEFEKVEYVNSMEGAQALGGIDPGLGDLSMSNDLAGENVGLLSSFEWSFPFSTADGGLGNIVDSFSLMAPSVLTHSLDISVGGMQHD